jgi:hypothetical protein
MRHQATGSLTISTDGIAEAVVEALRPLLADFKAPAPALLTPELAVSVLTTAVGSLEAMRTNPFTDHQIATQLAHAIAAAGYTLAPLPAPEPDPEQTSRFGFFGGAV